MAEAILSWEETSQLIAEAKSDPRAQRQQIAASISKMAAKADDDTLVKLSGEAEVFLQWLSAVRFVSPHGATAKTLATPARFPAPTPTTRRTASLPRRDAAFVTFFF
eukprot:7387463-Prymnesium_polylepis.2